MTGRSDEEMVAYALEIDRALLAFAPELLADLDVLGGDAALIVEALRELGLSERSTVVDLGCGKGGVAIAIAVTMGCRIVGVELFEPFGLDQLQPQLERRYVVHDFLNVGSDHTSGLRLEQVTERGLSAFYARAPDRLAPNVGVATTTDSRVHRDLMSPRQEATTVGVVSLDLLRWSP